VVQTKKQAPLKAVFVFWTPLSNEPPAIAGDKAQSAGS
jgi:hypothetical protein